VQEVVIRGTMTDDHLSTSGCTRLGSYKWSCTMWVRWDSSLPEQNLMVSDLSVLLGRLREAAVRKMKTRSPEEQKTLGKVQLIVLGDRREATVSWTLEEQR
jgi:hypothetical protein